LVSDAKLGEIPPVPHVEAGDDRQLLIRIRFYGHDLRPEAKRLAARSKAGLELKHKNPASGFKFQPATAQLIRRRLSCRRRRAGARHTGAEAQTL
jgi:hypothetical protein